MRSILVLLLSSIIFAQGTGPCATGETPCDPTRPWMRGTIEKSCVRAESFESVKAANPDRLILACACKHSCDSNDPYAEATGGRKWDALCEARCNPNNCACPHPCTMDP